MHDGEIQDLLETGGILGLLGVVPDELRDFSDAGGRSAFCERIHGLGTGNTIHPDFVSLRIQVDDVREIQGTLLFVTNPTVHLLGSHFKSLFPPTLRQPVRLNF
ncbi:MAG: hypothetical protein WC824_12140 [Bacteroidota bacterium]